MPTSRFARGALISASLLACGFCAAQAAPNETARFSWSVKALPVVTKSRGDPIQVSVAVGPVAASGVTVLQTALVEKIAKQAIAPAGLHLCRSATDECTPAPLALPANSSSQLWLWGGSGVGVFEGSVAIAAVEKPEGDAVAMTVNSSSPRLKWWGVFAIFTSVVLTWLLTVVFRNLINRKQLLLPVAITSRTLKTLRAQFDAGAGVIRAPNTERRIELAGRELSDDVLTANGLPSPIPLAGATAGAATIDAYRKHVQAQSDWVQALSIIVKEGLQPAWDLSARATDPAQRTQAIEAVSALDALVLSTTAPTPDALRQSLRSIVSVMNQPAIGAKDFASRSMADYVSGVLGTTSSPEQILVQIAGLGTAGWLFLLLATTLGGSYILVLGPGGAGFGTAADFAQCLLWGVGLPAGAQIMQSTTASIATSFGVTK